MANVAHEGFSFSLKFPQRVICYIDEWNSGSIYAPGSKRPSDYGRGGRTFVLSVDAFAMSAGDPAAMWDDDVNQGGERFRLATWKPLTDADGKRLPGAAAPFRDGPTERNAHN